MDNELKDYIRTLHGLMGFGDVLMGFGDEFEKESKSELETAIQKLREDYWEGECETPDSTYDKLVEELRKLDPSNALLTSPEHGDAQHGEKVSHRVPMLSLQKVYNKDDLMKWIDSVSRSEDEEFLVQPKYDGISCHYDNGLFSTRGDGNVGENVTGVCNAMCNVERSDDGSSDDFYGEIVIKDSDFNTTYKNVKRDNGETFKNSRNAVAGILNADDYGFYKQQGAVLTLIDYDKYSFSMKKSEAGTKWDIISGVINALDYPMDGIVVKIADKDWREQQGCTSHHPKGAMAFKFENASETTYLKSIDWGMGKEFITATAVFQPVVLNGVTISRASIPMKSKTLPCIMDGDFTYDSVITVERAGDVIPHITSVSSNNLATPFMIDKCPFCGSPIEILESGVRCTNDNCEQKKLHRLYDSLVQLGIKNVGEATVSDIYRKLGDMNAISLDWWVGTIPNSAESISRLQGYGEASGRQIAEETKKILDTTVTKFIAALGIPNVGIKIGREIEQRFGTVEDFISNAKIASLSSLDGIGAVMAQRIHNWLDTGANRVETMLLSKKFRFPQVATPTTTLSPTVCFTGAMRMKRSEMQYVARTHGYVPLDSVTKGLDILVVADDVDLTSSKCVKAKKYGTRIIREADFLKMCNSALEILS